MLNHDTIYLSKLKFCQKKNLDRYMDDGLITGKL